jgi:indolepyruvate ferredoxin oxidoreductase beta subunit
MTGDSRPRAITIAVLAMGGEGGGVLADWIVDVAEHAGYHAQTTSVPGVAQRTGATIYYIEIFPATNGRIPVLALMPVPGELDIVIASELMEAGRAIQRGLVTPDRTVFITSTHRVFSMTERTAMGDGAVDAAALLQGGRVASKTFIAGDFAKLAEAAHSVISSVLFGALAGSRILPFERQQFEDAIQRSGVGVQSSLAGFAAGFRQATEPDGDAAPPEAQHRDVGPKLQELSARICENFPAPVHDVLHSGILRLADFQDVPYASEYLDLLEPIRELDARYGGGSYVLLSETARYLALWMSYEDAVRVADLKTRSSRFVRVQGEVRAQPDQLVQISEFLHPGLEEIADILPASLGAFLLRTPWIRKLAAPWTKKGQIVETTSLRGYLKLYALTSLRPLRRKSLRYVRERKKIDEWLTLLDQVGPTDYNLASELAESPRLIKGYGSTHQLGSRNFDAIVAALPQLRTLPGAAGHVKKLHIAALADDTGHQLSAALSELAVEKEWVR